MKDPLDRLPRLLSGHGTSPEGAFNESCLCPPQPLSFISPVKPTVTSTGARHPAAVPPGHTTSCRPRERAGETTRRPVREIPDRCPAGRHGSRGKHEDPSRPAPDKESQDRSGNGVLAQTRAGSGRRWSPSRRLVNALPRDECLSFGHCPGSAGREHWERQGGCDAPCPLPGASPSLQLVQNKEGLKKKTISLESLLWVSPQAEGLSPETAPTSVTRGRRRFTRGGW